MGMSEFRSFFFAPKLLSWTLDPEKWCGRGAEERGKDRRTPLQPRALNHPADTYITRPASAGIRQSNPPPPLATMSAPTSIQLTHAFTLKLAIQAPLNIPGTPVGDRAYITVPSGTLKGSGIDAQVHPGGDYAIVGKDGYGKLDVRLHAVTTEGEAMYVQYYGHLQVTEAVGRILTGDSASKSTEFDDQYLLTTPVIEVAANSKHSWINRTVFVGKGRFNISKDGGFVGKSPFAPSSRLNAIVLTSARPFLQKEYELFKAQ